jgi:hypothetical protein
VGSKRRAGFGLVAALVMALTVVLAVFASTAWAVTTPVVVASNLDNPRHLSVAGNGDLYVAEAGRGGAGPCAPHPLGLFCFGTSGAVTEVNDTGADPRVLTGLPSIVNTDGEVLGPSDIAFTGSQKFVLSIGIGGSDTFRSAFGPGGALLGTLVTGKLKENGVSLLADALGYEATANPEPTDIDSNPVGILADNEGYVVADAGANAIVRTTHKGVFETLAVLPFANATLPFPPFSQVPADPVPTSVVKGPDGALYISQLTGFPFTPGVASIWRLVPGQAPTVYASGLTNMTDLAFGPDGSLYAVEIASNGLLNGPIGALKKITPGGSTHQTVLGGIFAPYGVAFRGNDVYMSTCAVCVGGGEVIKFALG